MSEGTFTALMIFILLAVFALGVGVGGSDADKVVSACQKELPRNQTCELYAKPKEIK